MKRAPFMLSIPLCALLAALTLSSCGQAPETAPAEEAETPPSESATGSEPTTVFEARNLCPDASQDIKDADALFWSTFHGGKFNEIDAVVEHFQGLLKGFEGNESAHQCSVFLLQARLGFLNTWRLAELTARKVEPPKTKPSESYPHRPQCGEYPLAYGCEAVDSFEAALLTGDGLVPAESKGQRDLQIPTVEGAGRLLPAVVQGFYAGSFPLSKDAAKFGQDAAARTQREETLLKESIQQTGWFNVASPPALAENTGLLKPNPHRNAYEIGGEGLTAMWSLYAMCADQGAPGYAEFLETQKVDGQDPAWVTNGKESYANAPWRASMPGPEVIQLFCSNAWDGTKNLNVPHVYQGNYLYLGDLTLVNCTDLSQYPKVVTTSESGSLAKPELCGDDWSQRALSYYEIAHKTGAESGYSEDLMQMLSQRLEALRKPGTNEPEEDLTAILVSIRDTPNNYPVCMVCHGS